MPTLPKTFRHVTRNTYFSFGRSQDGPLYIGHNFQKMLYCRESSEDWSFLIYIHLTKNKLVSNISYKLVCAYSEDSIQSAHPHSLITDQGHSLTGPLATYRATIEESDLTAQMCGLIIVINVCTCQSCQGSSWALAVGRNDFSLQEN